MEVFALNQVEEDPLNSSGKLVKTHLKILAQNNDQTPKFIGQKNIAVGVCQSCRSTRAVDRQRSEIRPLAVDRAGRPAVLTDPNG